MESGIIELAPAFTGSNATTAEEMKEYVQGVAARFCAATDLTVVETIDHERGAVFILGEEGKGQGIIAVGNVNTSDGFYYQIFISRLGVNNTLAAQITAYQISEDSGYMYYVYESAVWMKYVKCDHGTVAGFTNNTSPSATYTPKLMIQKARNALCEELVFLWVYQGQIMSSYNGLLDNDNLNTALFVFGGAAYPIIPAGKEALSDIYLASGAELYGMKLYTNKKGAKAMNKVSINGKQYIVAAVGNPFSIIMEASESVAAQQQTELDA